MYTFVEHEHLLGTGFSNSTHENVSVITVMLHFWYPTFAIYDKAPHAKTEKKQKKCFFFFLVNLIDTVCDTTEKLNFQLAEATKAFTRYWGGVRHDKHLILFISFVDWKKNKY